MIATGTVNGLRFPPRAAVFFAVFNGFEEGHIILPVAHHEAAPAEKLFPHIPLIRGAASPAPKIACRQRQERA